ncbi:hypothetical protein Scep_022261 [Stephania cephalantha]|uniref:Uncharacterized protein n=1 Tax=Stephania cephalantha TaxID=152367 RepID=A0AAP0I0U5_9MAGN
MHDFDLSQSNLHISSRDELPWQFVRAQWTVGELSPLHEPNLGLGMDAQPQ